MIKNLIKQKCVRLLTDCNPGNSGFAWESLLEKGISSFHCHLKATHTCACPPDHIRQLLDRCWWTPDTQRRNLRKTLNTEHCVSDQTDFWQICLLFFTFSIIYLLKWNVTGQSVTERRAAMQRPYENSQMTITVKGPRRAGHTPGTHALELERQRALIRVNTHPQCILPGMEWWVSAIKNRFSAKWLIIFLMDPQVIYE